MKVLQSKKCGSGSEVIFPTNRSKPTPNLAKYQEKSDLSTFLFLLRKLLFLSLLNDNGAGGQFNIIHRLMTIVMVSMVVVGIVLMFHSKTSLKIIFI